MTSLHFSHPNGVVVYENQPSMVLCQTCIREICSSYNKKRCEIAFESYDLGPMLFEPIQHKNSTICEGEYFQPDDHLHLIVESAVSSLL